MKSFNLKALTVALGLTVFSVGAQAGVLTFSSGVANFGNNFADNVAFSDVFTFSVANNTVGSFSATVSAGYFTFPNVGQVWGVDITNFSLTGPVNAAGTGVESPIPFTSFLADNWTISTTNLTAGNYSLTVTGTALPVSVFPVSAATGYGGKAYLEVSAVPEPETYGMMLAGLGLMGFVAARRKSV